MRRWWIGVTALLLLASCHRGTKQVEDTTAAPTAPPPTEIADSNDSSINPHPAPPGRRGGGTYIVEEDSAEITNLRLFARKQRVIYSRNLLVGHWIHGTGHEEYLEDGTGRMWDVSEDVAHSEAQRFLWTLDSNLLSIDFRLELGAIVPKRYVVTFADDENLVYRDAYGFSYMWDKVQDSI